MLSAAQIDVQKNGQEGHDFVRQVLCCVEMFAENVKSPRWAPLL